MKKRDILYGPKTPAETHSSLGREFLAREAYSDALDFFEKAQDEEGIRNIKRIALKNGDTFLLSRLERYDPTLVEPQDWEDAARESRALEKESMARFAELRLKPEAREEAVLPGANPLEEG